ncbi:hypothetical protein J2S89_001965 [Arthrobacter bambusae]|nr:hypothetical protein [Arthrobacter bambusae]MDQ0030140.1 hypothetical protein [Arthrobacter bambusae]MDQ0097823.1 hypothetical protein [Arthrobacter bambusae]
MSELRRSIPDRDSDSGNRLATVLGRERLALERLVVTDRKNVVAKWRDPKIAQGRCQLSDLLGWRGSLWHSGEELEIHGNRVGQLTVVPQE